MSQEGADNKNRRKTIDSLNTNIKGIGRRKAVQEGGRRTT